MCGCPKEVQVFTPVILPSYHHTKCGGFFMNNASGLPRDITFKTHSNNNIFTPQEMEAPAHDYFTFDSLEEYFHVQIFSIFL